MKKPFDRCAFAGLLGALALAACSQDSAPPGAPEPIERRVYRYDGAAGTSEATHEKAADGRESLSGTTDVAAHGSSSRRTVAREQATLDARGRLRHAEIIVGERGAAVQYTLDPTGGAVHVVRPGAAPVNWPVPNDAPWMYAPSADDDAFIATPVAAWVALRAASASDVVRVLEPEQQRSYLMTVDQVTVPTEHGTTVALGADGIDADAQFISELRLLNGRVRLARVSTLEQVPRT